jgi:uncharacterized phage-associated protein
MQEDYIHFDREKFNAVVHFICSNCEPAQLGNVKLHKILYFADMMHFVSEGTPLTGVDYLKQKFGPVARNLSAAINELSKEGKIEVRKRDYFGYQKSDYISRCSVPTGALSNSEIRLLTDVIDFVSGRSAREISELSHDVAWQWAEIGERIPYAAAFGLLPSEISEDDVASAIHQALKIRPQIEAERRESELL